MELDNSDKTVISVKLIDYRFSICDGSDSLEFNIEEMMWLHDILQCGIVYRTVYAASFTPGEYVVLDYSSCDGHLILTRKIERESGALHIKICNGSMRILFFYTENSVFNHSDDSPLDPRQCEIAELRDAIEAELEAYRPTLIF